MSDGIVIDDFITDVMSGFPDPVLEAQWGMGEVVVCFGRLGRNRIDRGWLV
jgi:hypothetical protein